MLVNIIACTNSNEKEARSVGKKGVRYETSPCIDLIRLNGLRYSQMLFKFEYEYGIIKFKPFQIHSDD